MTSQFGRCLLPAHVRMWNDLPWSVFDSCTLSGFKGAVNLSLLHWRLFSFFSVAQVLVGLLCNFVNVLFFPLGLASLILKIIIIIIINYQHSTDETRQVMSRACIVSHFVPIILTSHLFPLVYIYTCMRPQRYIDAGRTDNDCVLNFSLEGCDIFLFNLIYIMQFWCWGWNGMIYCNISIAVTLRNWGTNRWVV